MERFFLPFAIVPTVLDTLLVEMDMYERKTSLDGFVAFFPQLLEEVLEFAL